ncbi:MAG: metallophosphoesterase [Pseudomonadota bacterium]
MRSPFSRNRKGVEKPDPVARPRPERQTYIVGDVHGRIDLLERLLDRIDTHIGQVEANSPDLVFVGNYIDHGQNSAETLQRLLSLTQEFPENVICLLGNHERMLLDFLADPALRGARWLRDGANATLRSFGVDVPAEFGPETYENLATAMRSAMSSNVIDWIDARPMTWHSRNLWAVHAAADPQHPMTAQSSRVLLWGHPEFDVIARNDGIWIAHGHKCVVAPVAANGRISLNTRAWETHRLSAAAISPEGDIDLFSTDG